MMGRQEQPQQKLFYEGLNLDQRIRQNHPLRRINRLIDFDFVYEEVKKKYGYNGHVSIAPPVVMRLMLLLVFYNVRSERELMETLPERLDWLWFLGYDIDSGVPDHSVLSKARRRWGEEVFRSFFERVVFQCVEAGLVDGKKIFMDSSLVDADASKNSVMDRQSLKRHLNKKYQELATRLEKEVLEGQDGGDSPLDEGKGVVNQRYVSATDPDASLVSRGETKLRYQVHRAVDEQSEVITATEATPGGVNEAHLMISLLESHQVNTGISADTVVADSKYGTIDNYLALSDRGVRGHISDVSLAGQKRRAQEGIFSDQLFSYDGESDTYQCPAGEKLTRRSLHIHRNSIDYKTSQKACSRCHLREQCTRSQAGRTIKRHLRQDELDFMREMAQSRSSRQDLWTRQHLMERSFAQGKRYGFDRARWRRLWRVKIQEYLTAAIQNIQILTRHGGRLPRAMALFLDGPLTLHQRCIKFLTPFLAGRMFNDQKINFALAAGLYR